MDAAWDCMQCHRSVHVLMAKVLQVLTWFPQHDVSCLQPVSCFNGIIVCVLVSCHGSYARYGLHSHE